MMTSNTYTDNNTINVTKISSLDYNKYQCNLDRLIEFIFPSNLQHPFAASRLFIFGLYGPLDENNQIRAGYKASRVVMDYELDQMCLQLEREDIIQIYLHNPNDMGMLTSKEQEAIIGQADGHLKKEKGKASLPRITRQDIIDLFKPLPKDHLGRYNFHEMQKIISDYRMNRVKEYKLVFPSIGSKNATSTAATATSKSTSNALTIGTRMKGKVSTCIAPITMFQSMKGETNSDIVQTTSKYLSKHAFKISNIDVKATSEMTSNVRLLREVYPKHEDPYKGRKVPWDETSLFERTGVGSKVKATPSATTWKPKVTSY